MLNKCVGTVQVTVLCCGKVCEGHMLLRAVLNLQTSTFSCNTRWILSKALLGTTTKHIVTAADVQSIIMQKKGSNCWDRPAPHQATKVSDILTGNRDQFCYVVSDGSQVTRQLVCTL